MLNEIFKIGFNRRLRKLGAVMPPSPNLFRIMEPVDNLTPAKKFKSAITPDKQSSNMALGKSGTGPKPGISF